MDQRCTIFVGDGAWRVVCVGHDGVQVRPVPAAETAEAGPASRAVDAAAVVEALGGGAAVVVALPSSWCLSASVQTDGLGRAGRRQAMGYLLEEHLPLSSEDALADFAERHGVALGVCAEADRVGPLVRALEDAGLVVQHLCPAALLAGAGLASEHADAEGLLIVGAPGFGGIDLIEIEHKAPRRWWWLNDEQALGEQLAAWCGDALDGKRLLAVLGEAPKLPQAPALTLRDAAEADATVAAARQAAVVLAGEAAPWIDLRRDPLLGTPNRYLTYQKHATALLVSAAVLLMCVTGAAYWRGEQFKDASGRMYGEQVGVFKDVFPNRRPSGSLLTQLKRERDALAAPAGLAPVSTGQGADELYPPSALTQLHAVLSALPGKQGPPRYQVTDLVIEPDVVRIDGLAESHPAASQVAGALRSQGLYTVPQPNSRSIANGDGVVSYSIIATPKAAPGEGGTP